MLPHHRPLHLTSPAPGRPQPATSRADLTASERAVVGGLARGRAPKQLAIDCGVSLPTIRAHIQNAKRKTRARTLHELVAITTRRGDPAPR